MKIHRGRDEIGLVGIRPPDYTKTIHADTEGMDRAHERLLLKDQRELRLPIFRGIVSRVSYQASDG